MNKKGIIISGGTIEQEVALKHLEEIQPECIIGVDRGLEFLYANDILPTQIVGDFDSVDPHVISYYRKRGDIAIRAFNPVKDASDTEIALRLALELGVKELWILGGTGTRLDHVMANIQILKIACDHGVKAYLVDGCNRISLHTEELVMQKTEAYGSFFSVFPFGGEVKELTILGAKYPLEKYHLLPYDSRCVSNEFEANEVKMCFPGGMLLLMETRDRN